MKWSKRLLALLAGLLLGSVLIVAGVVLFFGESNYKSLLGWGAERFLNSQLVIEGPLKVDISRDLSLTSGDILLRANDDSYHLAIGKLHANFRLGSYLRTRTFWFNNLELQDIKLEVKETAESDDFSFEDFKIPPVVIAQAQFNNLEINYQELSPGTLHTFLLDELTIGELGEHQPLSLSAKGLFKGQPFVIQGTSGSIVQIFERQDPLTLQLDLSSELINANLQGTIAEPLNGRGLDLQIQVDISQVRDIIEIVWDEIPVLGSLQGSLNVRGDYTAPRLEEIDLHIQRGKEVDLIVKGSVLDVRSGTGLDLQLEGQSSNPEVLSWLLFKKHDRMQAVQVSGTLRRDATQFSLHDLSATAKTADGVKLQVDGSTVVHPQGYRLTQADAGLAVNFSAPTLAADNLFEIDEISELGPVSGSFELALGMDALAIYSADVDIGNHKQSLIMLKGDVGYVQLFEELDLSELNLLAEIQTAQIAQLGKQFDYALPAFGPAHLQGKLVTQGSELLLQGAKLNIGTKGQSTLHATGLLATQLRDLKKFRIAMDVDIQAMELAQLGKQLKYKLPALGPAQLRGKLITEGSELQLQGASLDIGTKEQSTLHATGLLATQLRDPKNFRVAMDVDIQASEFARLAEPFDYTLPELGPTHITGSLESTGSELHLKDGLLVVGATGQPTIHTDFKLTTQLHKGSTINAKFDMAVAQLIAAFSDLQPKNLGRLQGDAVISDVDGEWGFESFNLASTQTSLYQVKLNGSYDDLVNYDQASINSSLVIDSPVKLGEALGMDLSGFGVLASTGQLSIKKGHLQFDGKASLGSTDSTAKFSGYLKDSKPVLEGSFNIPVLYLADFGIGSEVAPVSPISGETEHERPYIFSRDEIDVNFLNKFDLDFVVSIDEVKSGAFAIDSIRGNIKLNDGHLAGLHRLVHEGNNIDFNLEIKALAKPEYLLSLSADDLDLGPLMAQVTKEIPIEGYSYVNFNLTTRGNTPHKMASNLSGDLDFELENAQIPKKYIELLSANVLGWVLSKSVAKDSYHNLHCVVLTFAIDAGEIKSKSIIADGTNLSLAGKIDMNLGKETLDIVLIPKEKKRLFVSSTPVKIHGPMKKPKVDAIPAKAAIQEIGTMALLPGVFIPLRAGEKLWSLLKGGDKVGGGCAKIDELREAAKNKAPVRKEK